MPLIVLNIDSVDIW